MERQGLFPYRLLLTKGALCSEYGKQQCYIISLLNQSSNTLSARNMPSFFYGDDLFVHQAFLYAVYI